MFKSVSSETMLWVKPLGSFEGAAGSRSTAWADASSGWKIEAVMTAVVGHSAARNQGGSDGTGQRILFKRAKFII